MFHEVKGGVLNAAQGCYLNLLLNLFVRLIGDHEKLESSSEPENQSLTEYVSSR